MGASLEAQMPTNMPAMQETRIQSIGQEYALEEGMATHSRILAWRIPMDRGSLASYSPEGRRVGHNWSDLACRHARTVRTRTQCSCMHTGICVLDLSIHLLSWGLTYQDCCVTWAAREVDPMGLANFASLQTILTLFVCWRCRSLCCILPWQKLRALSCFLGWPVYTPSERGVCLFFFFAQSSMTFASASVPETLLSPHSHSSAFAPAASHSHLQISFTWRWVHHYWTESILLNGAEDAKTEEGMGLVGHKLPLPPPPSCLLCRWVSVKEPLTAFLEWMLSLLTFRVGGRYSPLLYVIYLSSWWW